MKIGSITGAIARTTLTDNQSKALKSPPTSCHKFLLLIRRKNVPEATTRFLAYPNTRSVRRTLPVTIAKIIFSAAQLQSRRKGCREFLLRNSLKNNRRNHHNSHRTPQHSIRLRNPHLSHLNSHLRFLHPTHRKGYRRRLAKSYIGAIT